MKYTINKDPRGPLYITESEEMKLNYNCPADQKNGEGPGSCGGAAGGEKASGGSKGSDKMRKEFEEDAKNITDLIKSGDLTDVTAEDLYDDSVEQGLVKDTPANKSMFLEVYGKAIKAGKSPSTKSRPTKTRPTKIVPTQKDAKAQGFSNDKESKSSNSATGSLKGLREANDKGLITVAGKVKKDFSAGGKSYKKGDYVTHHVDGKWQDEK